MEITEIILLKLKWLSHITRLRYILQMLPSYNQKSLNVALTYTLNDNRTQHKILHYSLFKIHSGNVHGSRLCVSKILPYNTFELNHANWWKLQKHSWTWALCISLLHFKCNLISCMINIMLRKRWFSDSVSVCWVWTFHNPYYLSTEFLLFTMNKKHELNVQNLTMTNMCGT